MQCSIARFKTEAASSILYYENVFSQSNKLKNLEISKKSTELKSRLEKMSLRSGIVES